LKGHHGNPTVEHRLETGTSAGMAWIFAFLCPKLGELVCRSSGQFPDSKILRVIASGQRDRLPQFFSAAIFITTDDAVSWGMLQKLTNSTLHGRVFQAANQNSIKEDRQQCWETICVMVFEMVPSPMRSHAVL
jgi:hypothetical protein